MSPFDFRRTELCFLIDADLVGKIKIQREQMTDRSVIRSNFVDVIIRTYDCYPNLDYTPVGKYHKLHLWLTTAAMRVIMMRTRIGATRKEKSTAINGILRDYFENWDSFEAYLKTIEDEEFNILPMESSYENLMKKYRELQRQRVQERKCVKIAWE